MTVFEFANLVEAKPDHIITVLKPKIDMITITSKGHKAIEAIINSTGDNKTAIAVEYWNGFFARVLAEAKDPTQTRIEFAKKRVPNYKLNVILKLEDGYEPVRLNTKPIGDLAAVRLEFNPSHLPPNGLQKLCAIWEEIDLDNIPLPALIPDARLTRLDIAIDLLNISPRDLFVQNVQVAKIYSYSSIDEGIETSNFYAVSGDKIPDKFVPKGRAQLVVYDKKKEQLANNQVPLHGDIEHTRVERCMHTNTMFKNLHKVKFPFKGWNIHRAIIEEPPCPKHEWPWLLDSARYRGIDAALSLLPEYILPSYPAISKQNFTSFMPNDLIVEEEIWPHWPEAIKNAQLDTLIGWALDDPQKHMPHHGVFSPW